MFKRDHVRLFIKSTSFQHIKPSPSAIASMCAKRLKQAPDSITNYRRETFAHCHDRMALADAARPAGTFRFPQQQEGANTNFQP
jgi:hypothetical protein